MHIKQIISDPSKMLPPLPRRLKKVPNNLGSNEKDLPQNIKKYYFVRIFCVKIF